MDIQVSGRGRLAAKLHQCQAYSQRSGPSKSAYSVGHRAKALVQQACANGESLRQGQVASGIARRAEESAVIEASFVNLTYNATTIIAHDDSDLPVDPVPAAAEGVTPEGSQGATEGATAYDASAIFVSAQITFSAASVALELLR
ncbi:hypothetical protein PVW46_25080 [Mameliella sp. AT18]|nr:hypothetical protein [Mameliella sp. AT18]